MKKILMFVLCMFTVSIVFSQHVILLKSGQKMNGQIVSVQDGIISLLAQGATLNVKISDASAIFFDDASAKTKGVSTKQSNSDKEEKIINSGTYAIKYKVEGRTMIKAPKIDNLNGEQGTVLVKFIVDKYGNVLQAEATGTASAYLKTKAQQAAESAKFDTAPTTPLKTPGTMTIVY